MIEGCIKRVFDVLLTSFGLVVLSPVIILLVFLVRITLGSPVLFIQNRPGLNGKPFKIYKFRTMTDERGIDGSLLPDVERLVGFGRFLRSTSLDELPELLNVLKGDMSLVGPRPLLMEYLGRYSTEQARRHVIKPGITGWAQVSGRNALSWEDKFRLDVWYVDNQSLSLDVKILVLTVWKTIKRENISGEGHATMSKFMGSGRNV
jgi:lipopolysaccharide/colanic/teichoic acid biosynthesis glycosyltransferase